MRFTDENNNISVKDIRIKGDKVSGQPITKLAMYENIADTPAKFAKIIRSAQEMLDGIAFTPKQAETVKSVVQSRAAEAVQKAVDAILGELDEQGYKEAKEAIERFVGAEH